VETAFSGKAPRWNKEKISALIRLMTENSTIIKRKKITIFNILFERIYEFI
jgi:hypothetical protein